MHSRPGNEEFAWLLELDLSKNGLTGKLSPNICLLKSLVRLNLAHNRLGDRIPRDIGSLEYLRTADLSWNGEE